MNKVNSIEDIQELKKKRNKPCQDYLGNTYPSIKDMCEHYNISPETLKRRIRVYHLSLKEALTRPVKHTGGIRCKDHLGHIYKSKAKLCEHYKISRKLFEYRITHGYTLEEALTLPPKTNKPDRNT